MRARVRRYHTLTHHVARVRARRPTSTQSASQAAPAPAGPPPAPGEALGMQQKLLNTATSALQVQRARALRVCDVRAPWGAVCRCICTAPTQHVGRVCGWASTAALWAAAGSRSSRCTRSASTCAPSTATRTTPRARCAAGSGVCAHVSCVGAGRGRTAPRVPAIPGTLCGALGRGVSAAHAHPCACNAAACVVQRVRRARASNCQSARAAGARAPLLLSRE
jgi:hypothetical protein